MRDALVIAEIAATAVLLVTSGLLIKSFANLSRVDPGFRPDRALSLHLAISRAKHRDDAAVARYLGRLIESLRAIPGVDSVGVVNRLPMGGQLQSNVIQFEASPAAPVLIDSRSINGGYFDSLGVRLVAGRTFNDHDTAGSTPVGIVDERAAREVFAGADPLGKRFRIEAPGLPWVQIVGVAAHLRSNGLDQDPRPQVYWPYQQRTQDRMAVVIRSHAVNHGLATTARAAIHAVDPDQPLYDVRPMNEVVERTLTGPRLNTILIGAFAAIALILATIGLYGVVAYLTGQRLREFGLRMALGATNRQILAMVLRQSLGRVAVGLALGLALSFAVTRFLASMLHSVQPLDGVAYAAAALLLILVMLAASLIPAWRASRLNPSIALRAE